MVGMSFALRGGERRACVKWRVKWWLEGREKLRCGGYAGKPFGANAQGAFGGDMV